MRMLENKWILLISPESWDDHHVSKHHYANQLAQMGNKVYFLEPIPGKSIKKLETNLFLVRFRNHLKGIRMLPKIIKERMIARDFSSLQKYLNVTFDVIWNFDTSRFFDLSCLPKSVLKICHIVDLNQNFQWDTLAASANYCFGTTRYIIEKLHSQNRNAYFINHGYSEFDAQERAIDILGNNGIKAIYAGNLDIKYLDYDLLQELVASFPNVDFIFIGSYAENNPLNLSDYPNLFLTGKITPSSLSFMYAKADVLLVAYLAQAYEKQLANPHKIMEYLGSGKTVVATKTVEYADSPLIEMADSRTEFLEKFRNVISKLEVFNDEKKQRARKAFALANTYQHQINRIEQIIAEH